GRILVVDDEENLAEGIRENLEAEGYEVDVVGDGDRAVARIRERPFDLVVLDVMMPGRDGFDVCETVRADGIAVPILFLTAKGGVDDRIRGLQVGGDDYLPKPFHRRELLLRVRAILRRCGGRGGGGRGQGDVVRFGGNEVDFRTYRGTAADGTAHELTSKEAMILRFLDAREGEVVSREAILNAVWGHEQFPTTRTIDNFVVRLRRRFERDPERPLHFRTVRGAGYRFTREPDGGA
ncbi:MAG: response regulator transcription factor, partial [Planctomycetota bacterium JB042]